MTGLHQVWQHRMHLDADIEEQVSPVPLDYRYEFSDEHWRQCMYLTGGTSSKHLRGDNFARLTLLACCLALPIATLLWCVVAFVIALGAASFQSTTLRSERVFLAVILGGLGACACVVSLYYWKSERWEAKEDTDDDFDALAWVKQMANSQRKKDSDASTTTIHGDS